MLLYSDGRERGLVDLPEDYTAFKYGWVTTSHKSQGRTAENVVVAAQALDRKAFYVALSRGRKNMALHCPEKEFLKQQLSFRHGDRKSVHDLIRDREILPGSILPLSEEARSARERMLPDASYKSVKGRALKLVEDLKKLARSIWDFGAKIAGRRARNSKYGLGIVTEETYLEIERNAAIDSAKIMEEKQQFKTSRPAYRTLTAEIQAMLEDEPAHNFWESGYFSPRNGKAKTENCRNGFCFHQEDASQERNSANYNFIGGIG